MKKKHFIEDISDIKYCEENGLIIFSDKRGCSWEFLNNVWCQCIGKFVCFYNSALNIKEDQLYYYEEQEQQEASEDDLGRLCYCWNEEDDREELGILKGYDTSDDDKYHIAGLGYYKHCRKLSPAEVAEITGYKVEKAE